MPKNEDGEFELILGNRQLLSVFFIVVVLLGVFFTMGYIVGRNSSPPMTAETRKTEQSPILIPSAAAGTQQPPASTTPAPAVTAPPAETPKPVEPEPAKSEPPKPKPESTPLTAGEPAPGSSYLQVAAVAKSEAELFVDVLAKKGFHALYTPVPDKPATFRVLVGPFQDAAAIAQARTDLNKAGFKGFEAIVRKY